MYMHSFDLFKSYIENLEIGVVEELMILVGQGSYYDIEIIITVLISNNIKSFEEFIQDL